MLLGVVGTREVLTLLNVVMLTSLPCRSLGTHVQTDTWCQSEHPQVPDYTDGGRSANYRTCETGKLFLSLLNWSLFSVIYRVSIASCFSVWDRRDAFTVNSKH